MDIWIRSQNKIFLRKADTIGIVEGKDFWFICENLEIDFGKYKTKERALEVLDEIQKLLEDETIETEIRYIDNQEYERIVTKKPNIPKDKVVYEMPEE